MSNLSKIDTNFNSSIQNSQEIESPRLSRKKEEEEPFINSNINQGSIEDTGNNGKLLNINMNNLNSIIRLENRKKEYLNYRKGNMFMCFYDQNGIPLFAVGPHWPFFICLQFFVAIMSMPFYYGLWDLMHFIIKFIGISIYLGFVISYTLCFLKEPGIPPKQYYLENFDSEKTNVKNYRICRKCKLVMDLDIGTEHCVDCDVCIIGYDHHCPWTSKCIGKNNLKLFYTFITLLFTHIFYLVFALVFVAVTTADNNKNTKSVSNHLKDPFKKKPNM